MRFLESMLTGMIKDATGINAGRLVRRIGGRNILLAGGAALAGALAASQLGKQGGSPVSRWTGRPAAVPPPPPPPLPPLPIPPVAAPSPAATEPPSTAAEAAEASTEPELAPELLFAVVRTMAAAALVDGELTTEERGAIEGQLDASGLGEEQIRRIHRDLVLPPTPRELAAMVAALPAEQAPEAGETLYRAAAAVLRADREVSEDERAWLASLGEALGISGERAGELTAEVFG